MGDEAAAEEHAGGAAEGTKPESWAARVCGGSAIWRFRAME